MCETTSVRKIFALILAVCMVLGLAAVMTACGSGGAVDSEISADISDADLVGNRVEAPVENEFFTANNIEIETVNISESDNFTGEYVEISGLKNAEVQDKINTLIKTTVETVMDNKNPPPYRGAMAALKQYKKEDGSLEPADSYVSADVIGNVNNILSVEIYRNVYYGDVDGEYNDAAWFNEVIPLNIDLNTGEEIKLQDLFADNVDGLEYVNRYVADELKSYDYENEDSLFFTDRYDIKLTAPFGGFEEDVNFAFNSATGSITVFLDYKTPEFYIGDTGTSFARMQIPYSEYMGVTEKFMSEESLFTDETPVYWLITGDRERGLLKRENSEEALTDLGDKVNVYRSFNYYEDQDKDFVDYARTVYEGMGDNADFVNDVKKIREENDDVYAFFRTLVDCTNTGKYNIVYCVYEKAIEAINGENWETVESASGTRYITLDPDTGKPMEISDIIKSEEWEDVICQSMLKNMKDQEEYLEEDFVWAENTEEYLRAMIGEINGFTLNYDSIEFSFDSDTMADVENYIDVNPEYYYHYSSLVRYIPYRYIGCENMSIFG